MTNYTGNDQEFYWSVDVPGLTREGGSRLASLIAGSGLGLEPNLVDPANFLTLHIDRDSAMAMRAALLAVNSSPISDGLRESLEEWLAFTGEDLR